MKLMEWLMLLVILAVEVISKCIQRAIKKAKSGYGLLAYQDLKK